MDDGSPECMDYPNPRLLICLLLLEGGAFVLAHVIDGCACYSGHYFPSSHLTPHHIILVLYISLVPVVD